MDVQTFFSLMLEMRYIINFYSKNLQFYIAPEADFLRLPHTFTMTIFLISSKVLG